VNVLEAAVADFRQAEHRDSGEADRCDPDGMAAFVNCFVTFLHFCLFCWLQDKH
jgi:hypothetical protein